MDEWTRRDRFWDSYDHYRIHVGLGRVHSFVRAVRWELIGTEPHSQLVNTTAQWWTERTPKWLRSHGPLKKYFWQQAELDGAKDRAAYLAEFFGDDDAVEYDRRDYP